MTRFVSILLLACSFSAPLLHAQEPEKEKDKDGIKVRFLAEQAPKEIGEVTLAVEDKHSANFTLSANNLSEPQVAPARAFKLQTVIKNLPLAAIALPDAGKSFIVLLVPVPTGGFKPLVLRADDPGFKPGDTYFYNHSDKTVLGFVGTAKFTLEPGKGQSLHPEGARPEKFYDVGFGVREKDGDKPLSSTRWPVEPNIRSYVFFFTNSQTKRVDFRAVDEFVDPEKKKES
jgi:hypothetical protein